MVCMWGVCGRTWLCVIGNNESGGNWGKVLLVWGERMNGLLPSLEAVHNRQL